MTIWQYNHPEFDIQGNLLDSNILEITDDQIIEQYWDYWQEQMINKFGCDSEYITKENCITDWIVINWAWKKVP